MYREAKLLLAAAAAYIFAIHPGRQRSGTFTKKYYAHRGLHDNTTDAPENTLRAFQKACEAGYGIEMDLQLTKDGKVVVCHDFSLKRVCSVDGEVSDYTYAELQQFPVYGTDQRIPLFSDVLKLVNGRVPLILEMKYKDFNNQVCIEANRELENYKGPYVMESFQPVALLWYRRHRPDIRRGQLSMNFQRQEGNYGPETILMRHLLTNFLTRPDFIAYDVRDHQSVSRNICRRIFRCPSCAWTVKSAQELERIRPYYDSFIFEGFLP